MFDKINLWCLNLDDLLHRREVSNFRYRTYNYGTCMKTKTDSENTPWVVDWTSTDYCLHLHYICLGYPLGHLSCLITYIL